MDKKIVAIISAFNEEDIIGQVIADLVRQRVSVYVLDNGSTDRTPVEVAPFLGHGVIGVERFPPDGDAGTGRFEWQRILERKAQLARELDAEWFIHHDADEFREGPWAGLDLSASIERVDRFGYNAIDFELLNFWPTDDNFRPGQDVRGAFPYYEPGEQWNKIQIRCWKKTAGVVDLASTGGHEAIFPGRRIFPIRFILRHYPIRGQAHGARKVFKERGPRFIAEERDRGWHVQYRRFETGGEFIRDAATLIPYDADLVRLNLVVHHRGVEELEGLPETEERASDQAKRYAARIEEELDRRNQENERLERELDARNRQLEALHHAVHQHKLDIDALRRQLETDQRDREIERLGQEVDRCNRERERLERELDERNRQAVELHKNAHARNLEIEALRRELESKEHEFATELADRSDALAAARAELEVMRSSRVWRMAEVFRRTFRGGSRTR